MSSKFAIHGNNFKRFSDTDKTEKKEFEKHTHTQSLFSISSSMLSSMWCFLFVCVSHFNCAFVSHSLTLTWANENELVNKPVENQWTFKHKYGHFNRFGIWSIKCSPQFYLNNRKWDNVSRIFFLTISLRNAFRHRNDLWLECARHCALFTQL